MSVAAAAKPAPPEGKAAASGASTSTASSTAASDPSSKPAGEGATAGTCPVFYADYTGERQLAGIMALVDRDLSEPYSIFTYRYFLSGWPQLCVLAYGTDDKAAQESGQAPLLGVVVGKADTGEDPGQQPSSGGDGGAGKVLTGYIAMLAVETSWRRAGIGRELVRRAVERMRALGCHEVALETEVCNAAALGLYERLGFAREERLLRYYLNGGDAFRLKLWLVHDGGEEAAAGGAGGGDLDLAVGVTKLSLQDDSEAAAGVKR